MSRVDHMGHVCVTWITCVGSNMNGLAGIGHGYDNQTRGVMVEVAGKL